MAPNYRPISEKEWARRIWEVFGAKFPKFCVGSFGPIEMDTILISAHGSDENLEEFNSAKAAFDELAALSPDELEQRYHEFQEDEEKAFERNHPLNSEKALATEYVINIYSKMPYWTIQEGVSLILGLNPTKINKQVISRLPKRPAIVNAYIVSSVRAE